MTRFKIEGSKKSHDIVFLSDYCNQNDFDSALNMLRILMLVFRASSIADNYTNP